MYDWTHGESDYLEQISHSLCSLEFKPHRELYDWFLDQVVDQDKLRPKQREFARLNLSYTIMSKRKLLKLVEDGVVSGWDDPRMPTISGLRRRGYTPNAIKKFVETVGVAKRDNIIDVSLLEFCIREDLNKTAPRVMAVLDPVKLVITNYPEDKVEWLEAENNPEDASAGFRKVPFSRELYIEKEDFKEEAGNKFFRLKLGGEVRLKNAYIIKAESVVKDASGDVIEIHCTYSEDTERRIKGTLHWVSIAHAVKAEVREYDRLFLNESPDVFNKTVGLRDTWAKVKPKQNSNQNQQKQPQQQNRSAIDQIKSFGKKYDRMPEDKQAKAKEAIQKLAKDVSYDEVEPLFNTSVKKSGTRIITMITLGVLLENGLEKNEAIHSFIAKALEDKNALLVLEAQAVS